RATSWAWIWRSGRLSAWCLRRRATRPRAWAAAAAAWKGAHPCLRRSAGNRAMRGAPSSAALPNASLVYLEYVMVQWRERERGITLSGEKRWRRLDSKSSEAFSLPRRRPRQKDCVFAFPSRAYYIALLTVDTRQLAARTSRSSMLRRVLAGAIARLSGPGFSNPPPRRRPLLPPNAPRLSTARVPSGGGEGSEGEDDDDPFSFPDQQQLPPDV
uniref:Uncharacterized protein n=1 Tax=Aegilops tauschii subsp. strangulata TaxID=200361 RepID=A0A453FSS9_AEGTS